MEENMKGSIAIESVLEKVKKCIVATSDRNEARGYSHYHQQIGAECELCHSLENLHFHHTDYGKREGITLCEICHLGIHSQQGDNRRKVLTSNERAILLELHKGELLGAYDLFRRLNFPAPASVYRALQKLENRGFVKKVGSLFELNHENKERVVSLPIKCPKCGTIQYIDAEQHTLVCQNKRCAEESGRTRLTITPSMFAISDDNKAIIIN